MLNGLNARHIQHKCWLWVSCVCTCTCMYIIQRAPRFTDTEAALKIAQEEECSKQPQQQTAEYGDETVKKRDDAQHTEEEGTEKAKGRKRKAKPLESNVLYFYILPASLHVSVCCLVYSQKRKNRLTDAADNFVIEVSSPPPTGWESSPPPMRESSLPPKWKSSLQLTRQSSQPILVSTHVLHVRFVTRVISVHVATAGNFR